MRISVTERQLFKRCRRKWDWASYNRQSLTHVINAPALDLGTLIHDTLATWTQDQTIDPEEYYATAASAYLSNMRQVYRERVGCDPSREELLPSLDAIILGSTMIKNYKEHWHTPLPPGFTLIENELTLIQDIPNTGHCECTSRNDVVLETIKCPLGCDYCNEPFYEIEHECKSCECIVYHQLEATFDGVMADANGDLYIIERKTFARTPSLEELDNNDQFIAYMWALSKRLPNVVGVAYDGLLKRAKPVAGKAMDSLFLRRILLRSDAEIQEFEQELALEAIEMANNPPIYKTVPFMGCQRWECSFIDWCHAISKGQATSHLAAMFVKSERKSHLEQET